MNKKYMFIVGALMTQLSLNPMVYSHDGDPVVPGNVGHDDQVGDPSSAALPNPYGYMSDEDDSVRIPSSRPSGEETNESEPSGEETNESEPSGEETNESEPSGEETNESEPSGEDNEEFLGEVQKMINDFIGTFICNRNIKDIISLNSDVTSVILGDLVKGKSTLLSEFLLGLRRVAINNTDTDDQFGRYEQGIDKIRTMANVLAHENIPGLIKNLYVTVGSCQLSFENFINLLITADDSVISQYTNTMINTFLKNKVVESCSKGGEIQWQCFNYDEFKEIKQGISKDEFMPETFLFFVMNYQVEFMEETCPKKNINPMYSGHIDISVQNFCDRLMAFELAYSLNDRSSDVSSAVYGRLAAEMVYFRLNHTDDIMNHISIPDKYMQIIRKYANEECLEKIKGLKDKINKAFDEIINVASQKVGEMITNFKDLNNITDDNMIKSEVEKLKAHAMPIYLDAQNKLNSLIYFPATASFPALVTLFPASLNVTREFFGKLNCSYKDAIKLYVKDLINSFLSENNMDMSCPDFSDTFNCTKELTDAIASLERREDSMLCDKFCQYIDDDISMFGQSLDQNCVNEISARIRKFSCGFEHRLNYCENEVKVSQMIDKIKNIQYMENMDIVHDALKRIHNKEPLIGEIIKANEIMIDPASLEILIKAEEYAQGLKNTADVIGMRSKPRE